MKKKVLIGNTDAAGYMHHAMEKLKNEHGFTNMICVECVAHGLHNIAEGVRQSPQYSELDKAMHAVKHFFKNSPNRKEVFRSLNLTKQPPTDFVSTRWGLWFKAATFYSKLENLQAMKRTVEKVKPAESQALQLLLNLDKNEQVLHQAKDITAKFGFLKQTFAQLQGRNTALYKINLYQKAIDRIKHYNIVMKPTKVLNKQKNFDKVNLNK